MIGEQSASSCGPSRRVGVAVENYDRIMQGFALSVSIRTPYFPQAMKPVLTSLEIMFEDSEMGEMRLVARGHDLPVEEWVRQALRSACRADSAADARRMLATVREAALHSVPTTDIDAMLGEIERGALDE